MPKRVWSREKIVRRILKYTEGETAPSHTEMRRIDGALAAAATAHFGSWGKAVEAAGLDYEKTLARSRSARSAKITVWTKERVGEELLRRKALGLDLGGKHVREFLPGLLAVAGKHYGSWGAALRENGIDPKEAAREGRERRKRCGDDWTWREPLREMSVLAAAGTSPDEKTFGRSFPRMRRALIDRFGSWKNAVKAAEAFGSEAGK